MSKFLIDCGHTLSGGDTGAEGCGKLEQNLTREVGMKVISKLQALGHTVVNCTVDYASSMSESLATRVNKANNNGGDLYVCIHFNASNGQGHGTEVFTYGRKELPQARNILNNLCTLGFTNRGIKSANLYVINHTNMDALLVECCFIDNVNDMSKYNAENFANAIVKGLVGTTANTTSNNVNNTNTTNYTIRDFQTAYNNQYNKNISVDNIIGNETEQAMKNVLLKEGSKGDLVAYVQIRVNTAYDGLFGPNTKAAVMKYQKEHNLVDDGIVGYNTIKTIINQYK